MGDMYLAKVVDVSPPTLFHPQRYGLLYDDSGSTVFTDVPGDKLDPSFEKVGPGVRSTPNP